MRGMSTEKLVRLGSLLMVKRTLPTSVTFPLQLGPLILN